MKTFLSRINAVAVPLLALACLFLAIRINTLTNALGAARQTIHTLILDRAACWDVAVTEHDRCAVREVR